MTNQLVIFRDLFCPHDPKSEKNSRKSTNKNILALETFTILLLKYLEVSDWP